MPANPAPQPSELWTQAFKTWTDAWMALAGQTRTDDGTRADPFALWQRSFDQWLSGWSALLDQTLSTPEAAAAGGRMLDQILNVERPVRERTASTMQYVLEFLNMPSRNDLLRLATNLNDTNARLDSLQQQLEDLQDQVREQSGPTAVSRPLITTTGGVA